MTGEKQDRNRKQSVKRRKESAYVSERIGIGKYGSQDPPGCQDPHGFSDKVRDPQAERPHRRAESGSYLNRSFPIRTRSAGSKNSPSLADLGVLRKCEGSEEVVSDRPPAAARRKHESRCVCDEIFVSPEFTGALRGPLKGGGNRENGMPVLVVTGRI